MKRSVWFLMLFYVACTSKPKAPSVHISLVNNNKSLEFKGLDYAVISEINRDSDAWPGLLPVYRMPADTGMKNYQPVQPGVYQLKDSAIIFTPDTPFLKGQTYFLRFYKFGGNSGAFDFIKGRKKVDDAHYVDLIFKQ
jgi:hypothetical protein